mmetsp:Transcript_10519/g.29926  ORF Transcript_10519/g.29926 Transcript_10519/m.29926 type:complete len:227 (-) Transcript_10519:816-1496(-)
MYTFRVRIVSSDRRTMSGTTRSRSSARNPKRRPPTSSRSIMYDTGRRRSSNQEARSRLRPSACSACKRPRVSRRGSIRRFNRESDVVTVFSDSQVPCNLPIADVIDNILVESTQNSREPAVYWAYVFASEPNWTACPFALTGPPKRVKPRTDKEEPSLTASVTDKLSGKDAMPVVSATGRTVVEPQMSLLLLHVQLITDSPLPTGDKEYTFVPSDTRAMLGPMLLN